MFIGTPVQQKISPGVLCITGLSLARQTSGTLAWPSYVPPSGTPDPDVTLLETFKFPSVVIFDGRAVPLEILLQIRVVWARPVGPVRVTAGPLTNLPLSQIITGTDEQSALITITNTKVDETTQEMKIYLILPEETEQGGTVINAQSAIINVG